MTAQRRACDACHRRKIQCDRADPDEQCNWCQHHNLPCVINRIRGRKKRPTKTSTESLVQRLERVEESIAKAKALKQGAQPTTAASPAATTPSSLSSAAVPKKVPYGNCSVCRSDQASRALSKDLGTTPLGQIWFSGQKFAAVCSRNGIPHFTGLGEQWIYSRTGEWPRFSEGDPAGFSESSNSISPEGLALHSILTQVEQGKPAELPEKSLVNSLLQAFLKSGFRLIFPTVDGLLFEQTIKAVYDTQNTPPTIEQLSCRACVFAFVALMGHYFYHVEVAAHLDTDACAKQAMLLMTDILEDASLETLQTVILLFLYQSLCGHLQAASMYHAIACRTVSALGGHTLVSDLPKDRKPTIQESQDYQIRSLFWLCYFFDKDIALRTGQPPIMNDEYCDLTFPKEYLTRKFKLYDDDDNNKREPPLLPGDLRLSFIKSKALKSLYSASSLRKSDAELLRTIRELDDNLENWRASIPPDYSPTLYVQKDVKLAANLSVLNTMLHIELHLDYHYLLNIIHNASGRCMVDWSDSRQEKIFGLQSSLDLSVQASRATVVYLSEAAPQLAGEAFWVFVFYPISALMTIFFNVLRNPQHELAMYDLGLLSGATNVIRSMPIKRMTIHEIEYLQKMDLFIAELGRLSKAAIEKSNREIKEAKSTANTAI